MTNKGVEIKNQIGGCSKFKGCKKNIDDFQKFSELVMPINTSLKK